ncbi:hypothetical protein [Piscinibacter sp. XHJ-5]|uniref:hypothetical protein n=1 Tax=Piscinibacter sp. XHJ-5 TaxID=3037797 RepID=UPI002452B3C0|nr:hypothetical protein [Piscinibacter sp. XHJ-5]
MKTVFATLFLAAATTATFASEATQFVDPPSTLTRAEVRAQIGTPLTVVQLGNASVFIDPAPMPARAESSMLARMAGRIFNSRNFSETH